MEDYTKPIIIGAIVIALIAGGVAIFNNSNRQDESECTVAEIYMESSKHCILKTGNQYAEELAKIDETTSAQQAEADKQSGKSCISASQAADYVGVNGCVRMVVEHYYIADYGWAWLDSGNSESDFSVAALSNGIITQADAEYYLGKTISVRGEIVMYDGAPEIKITSKDAIFDVESQEDRVNDIKQSLREGTGKPSKEEIFTKRSNCFNEKIKNAKTADEKTAVYNQCKDS